VNSPDFNPIAESLRREVLAYYRERGEEMSGTAGLSTVETNSGFVERRGEPLVEILHQHGDLESIEGLRVLDLGCGFGALTAFFAARGASVTGVDLKDRTTASVTSCRGRTAMPPCPRACASCGPVAVW
jgi:2-polyprenyl-3-methyl-5-hydroxy-6-metoxy-1,4-benzoquinol methylase